MTKTALITGVTGQDGSYLSELLLSKKYRVYGMIRRSSVDTTERISHILDDTNFELVEGDITDSSCIDRLISGIKPDEVYNLAAMSHVGTSFDQPIATAHINAIGPLNILEAIRQFSPESKYYQASTSELMGDTKVSPQREDTPFNPNSPYAVAKLYAHHMTGLYRRAYNIFACAGILYNHETVTSFMPMFCRSKNNDYFDIKPICEIVKFDQTKKQYQSKCISDVQVWGKDGWVDVTHASAYKHDIKNDNKKPRFVNARCGAFMATDSHVAFLESEEKKTGNIEVGDNMEVINLPISSYSDRTVSKDEAKLLGLMVSDGSISYAKHGIGVHSKFSNSKKDIRDECSRLWHNVTGGYTTYYPSKSGFNPDKIVGQLSLYGGCDWLRELDIYNKDKTKRIPMCVLNSPKNIMLSFLEGYNIGDGLKKNKCTYKFKNFKTNSATLAMGLWYLISQTTKQEINITLENKNETIYYSLNLLSDIDNTIKERKVLQLIGENISQRQIARDIGISRCFVHKIQNGHKIQRYNHLHKQNSEVKKILEFPQYNGWFYDLETSSGEFHCGVGLIHVHNSPRRGVNFVTRKMTLYVAMLRKWIDQHNRTPIIYKDVEPLLMGNMKAKRDWSYAPDMVEGMWMILQHDKPDDYVLGSGETHSIEELATIAFGTTGLNYKDYIVIDKKFYRPVDVNLLHSDPSKAKRVLGWETTTSFNDMVVNMVENDYNILVSRDLGMVGQ